METRPLSAPFRQQRGSRQRPGVCGGQSSGLGDMSSGHTSSHLKSSAPRHHLPTLTPSLLCLCQMSLSGFQPRLSVHRMLPLDYLGEAKRSLSRADGDKTPHLDWSKPPQALLNKVCSKAGGKCEENSMNWGEASFGVVVNTWITRKNLGEIWF